ncbi:hypothetical protein RAC89_14005 [Paenibacillus sp. GD4]|jgi:hypothetical protein|nr:hypothetical protein [Paenibacillus sp. GD4]MDQ1911542.1 hypothetical protein [Paenibacillus sp. GD4]
MVKNQSNSSVEQAKKARENGQTNSPDPTSAAFDKKLDGPNRPAE